MPDFVSLGPGSFAPFWYCSYFWAAHSERPKEGWFNIFGLEYDLPINPVLPEQEEQAFSFAFDLTHNDGAFDAEPGFSHATVSLSSCFETQGISITPAVNYQWLFEDTVNDEDEFWVAVSVAYAF